MIVCVSGSRTITDGQAVFKVLDRITQNLNVNLVIAGGARGVDEFARKWARERGFPFKEYPARWDLQKDSEA